MHDQSEILLTYLSEAAGHSSTAKRLAVLTEMFSDADISEVAELFVNRVLDPSWNYYMTAKTIPEPADNNVQIACYISETTMLLDVAKMLSSRAVTGNDAKALVAKFLYVVGPATRALFKILIDRKLPGGIGTSLINKVNLGLIYKQPYGGVASWDPDKVHKRFNFSNGVCLQVKEDGMTMLIDSESMSVRTRQGQDVTRQIKYLMAPVFRALNGRNVVVHAEALLTPADYVGLMPRPEANGVFNALFKGERKVAPDRLVLVILDVVDRDIFYGMKPPTAGLCMADRYNLALDIEEGYRGRSLLAVVPNKLVYSLEQARKETQKMISEGGEGAVLKDPGGLWKSGKMTCQMKMKNEFECTLLCIGTKPHKKHPEWVGSLRMVSDDTKIDTYVGSGLNEETGSPLDRTQGSDAFLGGLFEIKAEKISKKNALDLPRVLEPRLDKHRADTYAEVLGAYKDSISINNC